MGSEVVDSLASLAATLSEVDRLALLRRLLAGYAATDGSPSVDAYASGYVVYVTDDNSQECTSWLLAPGTNLASRGLLACVYLVGMAYIFLGIAIISDVFMGAIEVITAAEGVRKVRAPDGRLVEQRYVVMNPTVANLTLMALGSSAPEILLSIIGAISTLDQAPDELGPSTIVGSAAFNLLVICGICISALPDGEQKKIRDLPVFGVTSVFSLLAYIWLYVVLQVVSPDVVEVWEAAVTLGMMFLLLGTAYGTDMRGRCCRGGTYVAAADAADEPALKRVASSPNELMDQLQRARLNDESGTMPAATDTPTSLLDEKRFISSRSGFMRGMTGQRRLAEHVEGDRSSAAGARGSLGSPDVRRSSVGPGKRGRSSGRRSSVAVAADEEEAAAGHAVGTGGAPTPMSAPDAVRTFADDASEPGAPAPALAEPCVVRFEQSTYRAAAEWGEAVAVLAIEPPCTQRVIVRWRALADPPPPAAAGEEALGGSACVPTTGEVVIEPDSSSTLLCLPTDAAAVPRRGAASVSFELLGAATDAPPVDAPPAGAEGEAAAANPSKQPVEAGGAAAVVSALGGRATVILVGADAADQPARGAAQFELAAVVCDESCGHVQLRVVRLGGADGCLRLGYATANGSAQAGHDYVAAAGELVLAPGVVSAVIAVQVLDDDVEEDTEYFTCSLTERSAGALLAGGHALCKVSILDDDSWRDRLRRIKSQLRVALKSSFYEEDSWAGKFRDALVLSGGTDEESGEELPPTASDSAMHALSLFWKLQFAFVPPASWGSGLPAFFVSLVFVGIWTAAVGEFAKLFGCAVGLPDSVTAITIVALGTSLPDTFASRLAVLHDEHADAAIGNVTGSNSVNVFLGLGIPWMIGALYHAYDPRGKGQYDVPAGSLAFSVALFTVLAFIALGSLVLRRALTGAEVGGGKRSSFALAFFFYALWLLYVVLASLNVTGALQL